MSTAGASILAVGYVLAAGLPVVFAAQAADRGPQPLESPGLEWQTDSPPPVHNFEEIPL